MLFKTLKSINFEIQKFQELTGLQKNSYTQIKKKYDWKLHKTEKSNQKMY